MLYHWSVLLAIVYCDRQQLLLFICIALVVRTAFCRENNGWVIALRMLEAEVQQKATIKRGGGGEDDSQAKEENILSVLFNFTFRSVPECSFSLHQHSLFGIFLPPPTPNFLLEGLS